MSRTFALGGEQTADGSEDANIIVCLATDVVNSRISHQPPLCPLAATAMVRASTRAKTTASVKAAKPKPTPAKKQAEVKAAAKAASPPKSKTKSTSKAARPERKPTRVSTRGKKVEEPEEPAVDEEEKEPKEDEVEEQVAEEVQPDESAEQAQVPEPATDDRVPTPEPPPQAVLEEGPEPSGAVSDEDEKTYCLCNGKDDGSPMITCEACDNWCVALHSLDARNFTDMGTRVAIDSGITSTVSRSARRMQTILVRTHLHLPSDHF